MSEAKIIDTAQLPKLHPVNTLMEEHRFIMNTVRALGAFVDRLEASPEGLGEGEAETLKGIAHHLVDAESHHDREEQVLFPRMQTHGVADLPARMAADHVQFRARKRRLYQLAQGMGGGDYAAFRREAMEIGRYLVRELSDHISTEDTSVYQRALEVLTPQEWDEVKRGCDAIGYCCFKPADQQGGSEQEVSPAPVPAIELDLRSVPHPFKLPAILKAWNGLEPGRSLRIINDKKPEPLEILFKTREKGKHEWRYEQEGPADWVALITRL
jgi:uncharacterized protein (DUF2249 family)/hemerythrin-like domain-containing protein